MWNYTSRDTGLKEGRLKTIESLEILIWREKEKLRLKEVFRIIGERQILPTIVKMRIRNYTGQCITKYSIVKDNLEERGRKMEEDEDDN